MPFGFLELVDLILCHLGFVSLKRKQQPLLLDPFFRLKQIIPSKEKIPLDPTNQTETQSGL